MLLILLLSILPPKVFGLTIDCSTELSGCQNQVYECSDNICQLNCDENYDAERGCDNTTLICNDHAQPSRTCNVECSNTRPCGLLSVISSRDTYITCKDDSSCEGTQLYITTINPTDNITVEITSIGTTTSSAGPLYKDPIIECVGNGIYSCHLECEAQYSCDNVEFICNTPNICNITCGGSSACRHQNDLICKYGCNYPNCDLTAMSNIVQTDWNITCLDPPTNTPTEATMGPTGMPTATPTVAPSVEPTIAPTGAPTTIPTISTTDTTDATQVDQISTTSSTETINTQSADRVTTSTSSLTTITTTESSGDTTSFYNVTIDNEFECCGNKNKQNGDDLMLYLILAVSVGIIFLISIGACVIYCMKSKKTKNNLIKSNKNIASIVGATESHGIRSASMESGNDDKLEVVDTTPNNNTTQNITTNIEQMETTSDKVGEMDTNTTGLVTDRGLNTDKNTDEIENESFVNDEGMNEHDDGSSSELFDDPGINRTKTDDIAIVGMNHGTSQSPGRIVKSRKDNKKSKGVQKRKTTDGKNAKSGKQTTSPKRTKLRKQTSNSPR